MPTDDFYFKFFLNEDKVSYSLAGLTTGSVPAKTALPDADIIVDSTLTASNDERLHNAALDTMEGMQIIIK